MTGQALKWLAISDFPSDIPQGQLKSLTSFFSNMFFL